MDTPLETVVTVKCDHLLCPEVDITIALARHNTTDLHDVRRRAHDAAATNAHGRGWQIRHDGTTFCPRHAHDLVFLL